MVIKRGVVLLRPIDALKEKLKTVLSGERYVHSLRVADLSVILARRFGADERKAETAGILYDCARDLSFGEALKEADKFGIILDDVTKNSPGIIHAVIGEALARFKYNINDREVLDAIRYHTTGRKGMSLLEKIVFIADYTEPHRDFPGVGDARKILEQSLDKAVLYAMENTLSHLLEKRMLIHLDTIDARNHYLAQR
ncbi:MAG: HD domain-containing protein [Clostridiales bacterium]|nr:HD domain-containing protein [Clostridiales bacterium]